MYNIMELVSRIKNNFEHEKIKAYKTVRETEKWWALLAFIIPLPFFMILIILSVKNNTLSMDCFTFVVIYMMITFLLSLYCWSYKIIQNRFRQRGNIYIANIIRAEEMFSANGENIYYLFIEFYVNKEKLIRRTCGYIGNPNFYLKSSQCNIYELNNKYIEGGFKLRNYKEYNGNMIKITKHKMFMPKGKKYV